MPDGTIESSTHERYWYGDGDDRTVALLEAVRRHRAAEVEMRRRLRVDMDMGDTDAAALRWIVAEERADRRATSAGLARELGVTTAATVKIVARLIASGDLVREPHPTDRRVLLLRALPQAHARLRRTLGRMHERMRGVAESFDPREQLVLIRFLDDLAAAIAPPVEPDAEHDPAPDVAS
ncbi:DNA-binding transcriptional regulator, MarR family [Agromyces sp. CF514]|uniref:MarR family winged helix-turn-helix transcriptional regulator n=1 Tax=Agromyces sp. CF514 TaxID=1881031 RepID=UPI0008DFA106|nr:MarR family transcriptional regulator [Agromyces sp. CF514]SFR79209.1 DNA-binding transcriptional regulator, MarR family [Agromyces sp. CF514]